MTADQIKQLQYLSIAYQAALEFDYCPDEDEVDNMIENIGFSNGKVYTREEVKEAFDLYQGKRPDELTNKIVVIIDTL